jgi:hypothetical protein
MPKLSALTIDAIHFIRENCEEMPPRMLAKQLKINSNIVRKFLSKEGLCCFSTEGTKRQKKDAVPFGCFNVNESLDWLTGMN